MHEPNEDAQPDDEFRSPTPNEISWRDMGVRSVARSIEGRDDLNTLELLPPLLFSI